MKRDLYKEAIKRGKEMVPEYGINAEYWAVRHAARQTAFTLLETAREVGVTDEQWEELRKVAAEVAYD